MHAFKKLKFMLFLFTIYSLPIQAMDLFCESSLLDRPNYIRYKIHLDGSTNWGQAVVSLAEGTPLSGAPRAPFIMPCQHDNNGDFICVLNSPNEGGCPHGASQTVFRWYSDPTNNWSHDTITLSFNVRDLKVSYDCHE